MTASLAQECWKGLEVVVMFYGSGLVGSITDRRLTVYSTNELLFHVSFFSLASLAESFEREIASKNVSSVASAV